MTFPILQHTFNYVGADELSLQHEFIYIFETFIFKYKEHIYLNDIEQRNLYKKYNKLLLDKLEMDIDEYILSYKLSSNIKQNMINKFINKYTSIEKITNNIFKVRTENMLFNYDNIKYIEKKYRNIELAERFRIIISNKKNKMLFNYNDIKYIEKAYQIKQIQNFVRTIIKNNNNEKELIRIIKENILINHNNKFISQFVNGDSIQKIEILKKLLEKEIKSQIKNIQNEKLIKKCEFNFIKYDNEKFLLKIESKITSKPSKILMINRNDISSINKNNKYKYLCRNNLSLNKSKNNKFIIRYENTGIVLSNQFKFIEDYYKNIYNNKDYNKIYLYNIFRNLSKDKHKKIYLYNNWTNIFKDKHKKIYLYNNWTNIFKEKIKNKYLLRLYKDVFNNQNKLKYFINYYKNISKNNYNNKFIYNFYKDIYKCNYNNKYLNNIWTDIFENHKIIFLKKDIKCNILFNNTNYRFFKKDIKPSILLIDTKQKLLSKYITNYIYKNNFKIKYVKVLSESIKKQLLNQYYMNKNTLNIRKNKNNKFVVKNNVDLYKYKLKNNNLIKINISYVNKVLLQKSLEKQETSIYYFKNRYKLLEKSWINIYKINPIQKYVDIQRKWWILGHDDNLTDKLIIPNIDYPYETNPVIGINKHPISSYNTINYEDINYGTKEIEISIKIMQQMLNYLFIIWNCALIDWGNLEAKDAMPKIMDIFYYWINLDNVKEEMIQKGSREDYLRIYRWFRWEAEKVWFKTKDYIYDENNNGIKSVGMLLGNIIEYMKNHHYNIVPITSSYNLTIMGNILIAFTWQLPDYFRPIDKYKGKRKYYISNKEITQIKKKLIYQR